MPLLTIGTDPEADASDGKAFAGNFPEIRRWDVERALRMALTLRPKGVNYRETVKQLTALERAVAGQAESGGEKMSVLGWQGGGRSFVGTANRPQPDVIL